MLSLRDSNGQQRIIQALTKVKSLDALGQLRCMGSTLANPDVQAYLSQPGNREDLENFQREYTRIIQRVTIELLDVSRYLFANLTELNNPETKLQARPASHTRIIDSFEALSAFIIQDILKSESVTDRAITMEAWIAVMQHSFELGDFHTTKVINTALNSVAILKLKATTDSISKQAQNILVTITDLVEKPSAMYTTMTKRKSDTTIPFYIEYKNMFGGLKELDKEKSASQNKKLTEELERAQAAQKPLVVITSDRQLSDLQSAAIFGDKLNQEAALQQVEYVEPKNTVVAISSIFREPELASIIIPKTTQSILDEQASADAQKKQKADATLRGFIETFEKKLAAGQEKIDKLLAVLQEYVTSHQESTDKLALRRSEAIKQIFLLCSKFYVSKEDSTALLHYLELASIDKQLHDNSLVVGTFKKIAGDKPTIVKTITELLEAYQAQARYVEKITEFSEKLSDPLRSSISSISLSASRSSMSLSSKGSNNSNTSSASSSYIKRPGSRKSVMLRTPAEAAATPAIATSGSSSAHIPSAEPADLTPPAPANQLITPLNLLRETAAAAAPEVTVTEPTPRTQPPLVRSTSLIEKSLDKRRSLFISKPAAANEQSQPAAAPTTPVESQHTPRSESKKPSLAKGFRTSIGNLFSVTPRSSANDDKNKPAGSRIPKNG